jgi:uncharacterized protein YndB with AHSA1/START domain
MNDFIEQLNAMHRQVGRRHLAGREGRTVVLRRGYDAPVDDVWDAITTAERINRWFLPVTGDLRLGGTYQFEGNAGGTILRCEPPRLLAVTWVFGEPTEDNLSEVEVRLSPDPDGGTLFELEHAAILDPERWAEYGPGAVGVGWDLGLLGLGLHLSGGAIDDPAAWEQSAEARQCMIRSSDAWGVAFAASGATPAEVAAAVANTTAFYAPDPDSVDSGPPAG